MDNKASIMFTGCRFPDRLHNHPHEEYDWKTQEEINPELKKEYEKAYELQPPQQEIRLHPGDRVRVRTADQFAKIGIGVDGWDITARSFLGKILTIIAKENEYGGYSVAENMWKWRLFELDLSTIIRAGSTPAGEQQQEITIDMLKPGMTVELYTLDELREMYDISSDADDNLIIDKDPGIITQMIGDLGKKQKIYRIVCNEEFRIINSLWHFAPWMVKRIVSGPQHPEAETQPGARCENGVACKKLTDEMKSFMSSVENYKRHYPFCHFCGAKIESQDLKPYEG